MESFVVPEKSLLKWNSWVMVQLVINNTRNNKNVLKVFMLRFLS
jgi:hypothetical protein